MSKERIVKGMIEKYYKTEQQIEEMRVDTIHIPEELSDTLDLLVSDIANTLDISETDAVSLINTPSLLNKILKK